MLGYYLFAAMGIYSYSAKYIQREKEALRFPRFIERGYYNMKKHSILFIVIVLSICLLAACTTPVQSAQSTAPGGSASNTQDETDAVTSASLKESSVPSDVVNGLSSSGYWIFAILSDVTLNDELIVSGEFYNKGDPTTRLYRKFSLYSQDENHNVTANYTLTVPQITVLSPAFRIQNGSVKGNIYVDAEGFELVNCVLDGNLTFQTQNQMDSADYGTATITGTVSVK